MVECLINFFLIKTFEKINSQKKKKVHECSQTPRAFMTSYLAGVREEINLEQATWPDF
jgi:hypothetical protein